MVHVQIDHTEELICHREASLIYPTAAKMNQ